MTTALNNYLTPATQHPGTLLPTPSQVRRTLPVSQDAQSTAATARTALHRILYGEDPRLVVVVGPCSVHDPLAAMEFGRWLHGQQELVADQLVLVMRAYVEKPRTRFGWNGLVNDPTLNGSGKIADGIRIARKLFIDLHSAGIPAATEFVDVMSVPFLEDTVSWAAIGARTAESPIHRQLASGLSCPVGFKNGTDGSLSIAIDGVAVARTGNTVACIDDSGRAVTTQTRGNLASHVILRGGNKPNHDPKTVRSVLTELGKINAPPRVLIDCSHGNANQPGGQTTAVESVARQIRDGNTGIMGIMLESNLVAGCQQLANNGNLVYGQSITDPCLGLDETAVLLQELAEQQRRAN